MELSSDRARATAASGYVFLAPLVANYAAMYAEAVDRSSPDYEGGFGRWVHRRTARSRESEVSERHTTSLHSTTWLDVRAEPWILDVPAIGGAAATRVADLWGHVLGDWSGSGDAGVIVIATNDWQGTVRPTTSGIVRSETHFVRCERRVHLAEPVEPSRMRWLQRSCRVAGLGEWSGHVEPRPAPTVAWYRCPPGPMSSREFWRIASFALSLTTPAADDRSMLDRLADIGVMPRPASEVSVLRPDLVTALDRGMDEAITNLMHAADDPARTLRRPPAGADRRYLERALATLGSESIFGETWPASTSSP